jgi:hypothetical protein
MAAGSLAVSVLGVSLAPPIQLSGNHAETVGIFAIVAVLVIAFIASIIEEDRQGQ